MSLSLKASGGGINLVLTEAHPEIPIGRQSRPNRSGGTSWA